jgi:collagenase-like PrtC family protease
LRFTFSNSLLEEKHIYDTYCNLIMEEADTGNNEVIVNSPILEQYLRENYPNYKYISSTTKCERNIDIINN